MAHTSEHANPAGAALQQDGRYELVAEYDNPTDAPIDAMPILYLYAAEKDVPGMLRKL